MLPKGRKLREPFAVTDCALIALATGERAHNLRELHGCLIRSQDVRIVYNHFWGVLLRPHFIDPEYLNDFASWAYHELHDRRLAEQLSIINPGQFDSIEDVRQQVIEVIEERMDEDDIAARVEAEHPFFFTRSQIVVFDSGIRVDTPEKLVALIPGLSLGSVFYHFIDARRRIDSGLDDFSEWLGGFNSVYGSLVEKIAAVDPYFNTLHELRQELTDIFRSHFETETTP
jgi:hypothetical protein